MEHQVSDILINTWGAMLTLMLFMYVALDGFDLGVGVLTLLERDGRKKSLMMQSLSGVWDANETGQRCWAALCLAHSLWLMPQHCKRSMFQLC